MFVQFVTGTKCEPETRRECVEIEYTECGTMKVDDCDPSKVSGWLLKMLGIDFSYVSIFKNNNIFNDYMSNLRNYKLQVRIPAQDFIHKKKCLLASEMEKLASAHKHK